MHVTLSAPNIDICSLSGTPKQLVINKSRAASWRRYVITDTTLTITLIITLYNFLVFIQSSFFDFFILTLYKKQAEEERAAKCMVVEMGAAAASGGMFGKALVATWANKTVAQAVKILGEDDVEVTNKRDKEILLPKLFEVEKLFIAIVRGKM